MAEQAIWGLHAGRTGDAHSLFINKNRIAVGWRLVGNLMDLGSARENFKKAVADAYPDSKTGAVPVSAGQLYRFLFEVKPKDYVVYPSKSDKKIYIGRITGAYEYVPADQNGYPHQREVQWLKKGLPRTSFSQGALYEIGSAMSLFQVKNYAEEFLAAIENKPLMPGSVDKGAIGQVSADDAEQNTKDFILKTLSRDLKGHPLADFIGHLLNKMGYVTRVSPPGADGGIDIEAHKDELGFEEPFIKVQVKSKDGNIGEPDVSALSGKLNGPKQHGLFVTLGGFTNQAKTYARNQSNMRLVDGEALVDLILAHYEDFESEFKSKLPLKRIYVPNPSLDETASD